MQAGGNGGLDLIIESGGSVTCVVKAPKVGKERPPWNGSGAWGQGGCDLFIESGGSMISLASTTAKGKERLLETDCKSLSPPYSIFRVPP